VIKALESFGTAPSGRTRNVILLSDGGDTASTATLDQALTAVRSSGIPIYVIGLKSTEFDSGRWWVVDASGSRYLETPDPGALGSLYETLAQEIHNQYLLTFTLPPSSLATSDLTVQVTAGGQTVQTEQGFFYPTTTTIGATDHSGLLVTVPAVTVAGSDPVGWFLRWESDDWIIGAVVFLIVLAMLWVLSECCSPNATFSLNTPGL
jgi:hypothetical protein